MNNINTTNTNFTSRCKEIELARRACREVSVYSPSRQLPLAMNIMHTNPDARNFLTDYTLESLYNIPMPTKNHTCNVLASYMDCHKKINNARTLYENSNIISANNLLEQVTQKHLGKCGECAESVSIILNMNGIDNAYCTTIRQGKDEIYHEVCLFNRDGSPVDKIDNRTIIADAWSGIVDFANNALEQIKNTCSKHFNFREEEKLTISPENIYFPFKLNDLEIKILRAKYPNLVINK